MLQAIKVPVREFFVVTVDRKLSPVEMMQKLYPLVEEAADRLKEFMDSVVFVVGYLSEGEGIAEIKEFAESMGTRFILIGAQCLPNPTQAEEVIDPPLGHFADIEVICGPPTQEMKLFILILTMLFLTWALIIKV